MLVEVGVGHAQMDPSLPVPCITYKHEFSIWKFSSGPHLINLSQKCVKLSSTEILFLKPDSANCFCLCELLLALLHITGEEGWGEKQTVNQTFFISSLHRGKGSWTLRESATCFAGWVISVFHLLPVDDSNPAGFTETLPWPFVCLTIVRTKTYTDSFHTHGAHPQKPTISALQTHRSGEQWHSARVLCHLWCVFFSHFKVFRKNKKIKVPKSCHAVRSFWTHVLKNGIEKIKENNYW